MCWHRINSETAEQRNPGMPPKSKKVPVQVKLKHINKCVADMMASLPKQTFSAMTPNHFEPTDHVPVIPCAQINKSKKRAKPENTQHFELCSSEGVVLSDSFMTVIPRHPNVQIICSFCRCSFPSMSCSQMEQPHARRRFTPMCECCFQTNAMCP